jgi:NUMOD3 motif
MLNSGIQRIVVVEFPPKVSFERKQITKQESMKERIKKEEIWQTAESSNRDGGKSPELNDADSSKEKTPTTKPRKRKSRINYDSESVSDNEHVVPTILRKTIRGGYSHTKRSRARISKANKGNTPWNKGRERSEEDKAKIAAAVRARNQAILQEKLKMFNMTEEEFRSKQKQIKYLRERLRRAKVLALKRQEQPDLNSLSLQAKLEEAIAVRDRVMNGKLDDSETLEEPGNDEICNTSPSYEMEKSSEKGKSSKFKELNLDHVGIETDLVVEKYSETSCQSPKKLVMLSTESPHEVTTTIPHLSEEKQAHTDTLRETQCKLQPIVPPQLPITPWNMEWTSHEFDVKPSSCPNGGPSGLVCCEECSFSYSQFLSQTVQDMEVRRMESVSNQVEELLGFIEETRMQLMVTSQAAQLKAPPRPFLTNANNPMSKRGKGCKPTVDEMHNQFQVPNDWCVTSTLDMNDWDSASQLI